MTINDLYKLKNIRTTIHTLRRQMETLDRYGESNDGTKKPLQEALTDLYLQETEEQERLRSFIGSIEDQEVREILRLRFLDGLPWIEVATEVTPLEKDATRSAPRKKVERYLKKYTEMSHISKMGQL